MPGAGDTVAVTGTGTGVGLNTVLLSTHTAVCAVFAVALIGGVSRVYENVVLLNMDPFADPEGCVISSGFRAKEYKLIPGSSVVTP
jgi:hypothetical protein